MTSSNTLYSVLDKWIVESIPSIQPGNSRSISPKAQVQSGELNLDLLEFSWSAYLTTLFILGARVQKYMSVLSIDLESSICIDTNVPSWKEIRNQITLQGPVIYLLDRFSDLIVKDFESYHAPLREPPPFVPMEANVYFSYSCSRSEQGEHDHWEYNRTVYARHYPPEFQLRE
jgi:hypothetical protein